MNAITRKIEDTYLLYIDQGMLHGAAVLATAGELEMTPSQVTAILRKLGY